MKVHLMKICKTPATRSFFLDVLLAFTSSADIIFHNFLEFNSTLSEKLIFVMNFCFLMDLLKPFSPTPAKLC